MQFFTATGVPLAGGLLYTYAAGTTLAAVTYTDSTGTATNTNPVVLNARGECSVWLLAAAYKFVLRDPTGALIWTADNLSGLVASGDLANNTSSTLGSALVGYLPAGVSAVGTNVQIKLRQTVSVKDFGAKGDGSTNDTAAIQYAVNACQLTGASLYIPAGTYKATSSINITTRLHLYGDSAQTSVIQSTAAEAIIVTVPANNYSNRFSHFHDFGIEPATAGTGTSGFVCRTAAVTGLMSNFVIERIYIGDFGSFGLVFDNSVSNPNGFFTFSIRRCWFTNGMNLIKVGDSVNIEENTITDGGTVQTNFSGGRPGILYTSINAGARQVVFRSNSITTSGGAIVAINASQLRIENNQCEYPFYYYIPYGASTTAYYAAQIYLSNCTYTEIRGNTIQPGGGFVTNVTGTTNSTTSVTAVSSMSNVYVGCTVQGSGIPTGTTITVVGASSFTMSASATTSLVGTALVVGYSPAYAVLMEGAGCSFNVVEMNDIFRGTYSHIGLNAGPGVPVATLGLGNTYAGGTSGSTPDLYNPDGNLYGWGLPQVTSTTLPPATTTAGALVYSTTDSTVQLSNGVVWSQLGGNPSPTLDSIFTNSLVDLWTINGKASGPPDGFLLAGGSTAVAEASIVWPFNLTATSIEYTQNSAVLANSLNAVPANQPWLATETLSILAALYMPTTANRTVRIYSVLNGSTALLGEVAADSAWHTITTSFNITPGTTWGLYIAIYNTTSGLFTATGEVCYIGGLNITRGSVSQASLSDSAARRAWVANNVTYTPPFLGARAYVASTGKWYMAAGQASPADWIILN
jgi:hypothetical protein